MRAIGLCLLVILFPVFACLPVGRVHAAELININTANAELLDTLPGIGSSKATAIVEYRTKNGLFATIEDIQNVSGIGPATFANIQALITVDDTGASNTNKVASSTPSADTSTKSTPTSSGGMVSNTPPPSALVVDAGDDQNVVMNVPFRFSARAMIRSGAIDSLAHISWGFGDGSSAEASAVEKTYHYAGTYLVVVTATDGLAMGHDEIMVTVRPAHVRIAEIPDIGIMIFNDADERLDLSNWRLFTDTGFFRIPSGTVILPKASALLPILITNLKTAPSVTLAYPDGMVAAHIPVVTFAVPTIASTVQPTTPQASSSIVQTVEPIINTKTNAQAHDEAVSAPAAATELAAAGAALSSSSVPIDAVVSPKNSFTSNLFKSPWIIGFLSVVALAGGAFIFL